MQVLAAGPLAVNTPVAGFSVIVQLAGEPPSVKVVAVGFCTPPCNTKSLLLTITSNPDGYLFGSCFAKYDVAAARAASKVGLQVAAFAVSVKPPIPTIAIDARIPTTTIVRSSSMSVNPRSSG